MQSRPNSLLAMASRLSNLPMRQVSVVALALVFLFGVYTLLGGDTASYNLYGPGSTGAGGSAGDINGALTHSDHSKPWSPPGRPPPANPAVKETGRVVGLVFFGRRDHVKILDCYLQVRAIALGTPEEPQLTFRRGTSRSMVGFWTRSFSLSIPKIAMTSPTSTTSCSRTALNTANTLSRSTRAGSASGHASLSVTPFTSRLTTTWYVPPSRFF
jgi:hypothetical protein